MSGVEVSSNVQKVKESTDAALKRAAMMIGGTIEGHAKELCPVDTGLLRNSITYAMGGGDTRIQSYKSNNRDKDGKPIEEIKGQYSGVAPADEKDQVTVYVGSNVEYAPYQELGAPAINLDARPFLRPAFENFQSEIQQIIEQQLGKLD